MYLKDSPEGCLVDVYVQPRAAKARVTGMHGGRLRLAVTEPPEDGRANEAVCRLLADRLGVAPTRVRLIRGGSARAKTLCVAGLDARHLARLLCPGDAQPTQETSAP